MVLRVLVTFIIGNSRFGEISSQSIINAAHFFSENSLAFSVTLQPLRIQLAITISPAPADAGYCPFTNRVRLEVGGVPNHLPPVTYF